MADRAEGGVNVHGIPPVLGLGGRRGNPRHGLVHFLVHIYRTDTPMSQHFFLVRHGDSEDGPKMDPTRAITETGRREAAATADFLARWCGHIPVVLASNMLRARQTAQPIKEAVGAASYEEIWQLDPDVDAQKAWRRIKQLAAGRDVLAVTHEPLVSALFELTCGAKTGGKTFEHAGCACIHVEDGHLKWFVSPALVERDEELESTREAAAALAEAALELCQPQT